MTDKTKEELIEEIGLLRKRIAELEILDSERKRAEEALRENEERYRIQFEQTMDALFLADTETGIIIDCNKAAVELIGRKKSEMVGQYQRILHPSEEWEEKFSKSFKQQVIGENFIETKVITKSGEIRNVEIKASTFDLKGKKVILAIFRDITERKKAEETLKRKTLELEAALEESNSSHKAILNMLAYENKVKEKLEKNIEELQTSYSRLKEVQAQVVQSAKLASIGQLVGGVAHEINNPLTGVLNNVQLIKMEAESKESFDLNEFKQLLDIIEKSAMRCKGIVQSLLNFSHASTGIFKPISLNEIGEKVIILVEHELKLQNILFKKDLQPDLPLILGDSQLLQQVIFNFISNAKWAIQKKSEKEGGIITIKTQYEAGKKEVCIFVSDSGIGISAENLKKIFDSFFSTKEVEEGTGLGLSLVQDIIHKHGGRVEVESQLGEGATFKVVFPAS